MAETVFTQPTTAAMLAASRATPRGAILSASGMVAARSARATEVRSSSSRYGPGMTKGRQAAASPTAVTAAARMRARARSGDSARAAR